MTCVNSRELLKDSMKRHKGIIVSAVLTTFVVIMLATVQLYDQFGTGRGFTCLKCGTSFSKSSDVHFYSEPHKEAFSEKWFENVRVNRMVRHSNKLPPFSNSNTIISTSLASYEVAKVIRVPVNCVKNNCREFLSDFEKDKMSGCMRKAKSEGYQIKDSNCKFLPSTGRHPVALISAQGSGNTWTRGLLEKATGICTGFFGCDTSMRAGGYIGEMIKSGQVLVVKTHSPVTKWIGSNNTKSRAADAYYSSAVFILRNPIHSAIAEWNRRLAQLELGKQNSTISQHRHTYVVTENYFKGKAWDLFLHSYMTKWKLRLHQWVIDQDTYSVHIIRYEDLKKNTVEEVKRVLDFLNVYYNSDTLADVLKEDYSEFRRPHSGDNFEHYSVEQKEWLKHLLLETMEAAEKAGKSKLLRLDEYLSPLEA